MKKLIDKFKNYHPNKLESFLYFNIPLLLILVASIDYNDIWFILNHGKYIIEHGIPNVEPFSIHQNFSFMIQQPLTSIIYYLVYSMFGKNGLMTLISLTTGYIIFITYKLCMLISDNRHNLSVMITTILTSFLTMFFITLRPHNFTYAIILTTLYFLEKYIKENKTKYLYPLPILSCLLVNFHASMFFIQFAFLLPYLIDSFKYKIGPLESKGYRKKPLFITSILMLLAGLINPYGLKGITYLFRSYGNEYINKVVYEMFPTAFIDVLGKIVFILIFSILLVYMLYRKNNVKPRYLYLYLGTVYLTLSSYKGMAYLVIGGIFPLAYYLKNSFRKSTKQDSSINFYKTIIYSSGIFIIFFIIVILTNIFPMKYMYKKGIDYILENNKKEDVILYNGYAEGAYPEWRGIKCYIDPRAEVFIKSNNKKEDIFVEYYNLQKGKIDVKTFLDKYKFTHMLVTSLDYLYYNMKDEYGYEIIYEGKPQKTTNSFNDELVESYRIYERKK